MEITVVVVVVTTAIAANGLLFFLFSSAAAEMAALSANFVTIHWHASECNRICPFKNRFQR